jgi:hypothetical protein
MKWKWMATLVTVAVVAACDGVPVVGGRTSDSNDAAMDSTADAPDAVECPSPLIACNDRCIDPRSDRENCGACRRACGASEVCQNSSCVPDCAMGESLCTGGAGMGLVCASLQTSREHCGACGNACSRDQVCSNGACTFMCTGAATECAGGMGMDGGAGRYCAELTNDRMNCGACGNTCIDGYSCMDGRCRIRCDNELLARCPNQTVATTASKKTTVRGESASPSKGTAKSPLRKGCTTCTWLTCSAPPRASALYQAKKPSHIDTTPT